MKARSSENHDIDGELNQYWDDDGRFNIIVAPTYAKPLHLIVRRRWPKRTFSVYREGISNPLLEGRCFLEKNAERAALDLGMKYLHAYSINRHVVRSA